MPRLEGWEVILSFLNNFFKKTEVSKKKSGALERHLNIEI
jgi:hypothetical protein